MKRRLQFLRTLFWRERYSMPQRTTLCLRLANNSPNAGGKGWTVVITRERRGSR